MKIIINSPAENPGYATSINTGAMQITVLECFSGVRFITKDGEIMTISMRDSGFEGTYQDAPGSPVHEFEYKNGEHVGKFIN
jgi:hypothetical protein